MKTVRTADPTESQPSGSDQPMRFLRKTIPRRFSLRTLLLMTTVASIGIGSWYGKARQRVVALKALRDEGEPKITVYLNSHPPAWLKAIGIADTSPLFVDARASIDNVWLGSDKAIFSGQPYSLAAAQQLIIERRNSARGAGVDLFFVSTRDIESGSLDEVLRGSHEWRKFFVENDILQAMQDQ